MERTLPQGMDRLAPRSEFRIRFYNFNMGNNARFRELSHLPAQVGHSGGTFEEMLHAPFVDGKPLDLAFASLVETRIGITDWVAEWSSRVTPEWQLDEVVPHNAREAASKPDTWAIRSLLEGFAVNYNGNLKTILAFSSKVFKDSGDVLFGRLPESRYLGYPIPNPKKAFTGSSVMAKTNWENLRLIFAGAHFPVEKVAEMFEAPDLDVLAGTKIAMAKILRKILRRACGRGMVDSQTLLILQGDLNSRTVLKDDEQKARVVAADALKEVLADPLLQAAIQHDLPLPSGCWREVVQCDTEGLPVTYKYGEELGSQFKGAKPLEGAHSNPVTIGNVLKMAESARASGKTSCPENVDCYKKTMESLPRDQVSAWGLQYKEGSFRPFRFPASADRVIYWAPLGLAARVSWELPKGGYEVNHWFNGSDHRPVSLEAKLRISKPVLGGAQNSFQWAGESNLCDLLQAPSPELSKHEVCDSDDEDSEPEPWQGPAGP